MSEKALRYNEDKLQWHNFPIFLMEPVIKVADFGEKKYETFNFLKGGNQNQYLDSMKRHLCSFENPGESDNDKESGVNHLAHLAWNALVAIYMLEHHPEMDDRFKPFNPADAGLGTIT